MSHSGSAGRVLAAVSLAISSAVGAPAAGAAPSSHLHVVRVLSNHFVGPLQFAVSGNHVYVADSFTSTLKEIGGSVLAHGPSPSTGGDLAGIAVNPQRHEIAYTTSNGKHTRTQLTVLRNGRVAWSANLAGFEAHHNPDHKVVYGLQNPTPCRRHALMQAHVPVRYQGLVDSHPYAVTALPNGAWAVADAGGNDLLRVTSQGAVRLIRVLPRETVTFTHDMVVADHFPACVEGAHYGIEAVPTDVERGGAHGYLYVSTLGGANFPNMGRVYRITNSGVSEIGSGFNSATNLAVTKGGSVLVAELASGRISRISGGHPVEVATLPDAAGVEYANKHFYASTAPEATGTNKPGRVVLLGS